jgi:hypothetical protein
MVHTLELLNICFVAGLGCICLVLAASICYDLLSFAQRCWQRTSETAPSRQRAIGDRLGLGGAVLLLPVVTVLDALWFGTLTDKAVQISDHGNFLMSFEREASFMGMAAVFMLSHVFVWYLSSHIGERGYVGRYTR